MLLFTNVPLKKTIDITFKTVYGNNEISEQTYHYGIKELLMLYTKNEHFTFDNQITG